MKKFIQIASLLSLLAAFTVISANAQNTYGSETEIPFAFNVGDRSYDSGTYIFKVSPLTSGIATLSITDTENDKVQIVHLTVNGDDPAKNVKLHFDNVDDRRFLSKVTTPSYSYTVIKGRSNRESASIAKPAAVSTGAIGGTNAF